MVVDGLAGVVMSVRETSTYSNHHSSFIALRSVYKSTKTVSLMVIISMKNADPGHANHQA